MTSPSPKPSSEPRGKTIQVGLPTISVNDPVADKTPWTEEMKQMVRGWYPHLKDKIK